MLSQRLSVAIAVMWLATAILTTASADEVTNRTTAFKTGGNATAQQVPIPAAEQRRNVPKDDGSADEWLRIVLQIDQDDLIAERAAAIRDDVRHLLRSARIGYTGLSISGRRVQVRVRDDSQVDAAKEALGQLTQPIASSLPGSGTITELALSEPEPGLLLLSPTDEGLQYRVAAALVRSVEVVIARLNGLGITEPIIQTEGKDRIMVEVPDPQDPGRLKDFLVQKAELTFQIVDQSRPVEEAIKGRPPTGTSVMYSMDDPPVPYLVEDRVVVSGENLVDARAAPDQRFGEPFVAFRFDTEGRTRFGQATQQNVGRLFAIILDGQVLSAPLIREPILGDTGQISGNFTMQSANDLALLLRAGALPSTLTVAEEQKVVGPAHPKSREGTRP